jgi:hypothetical protein
MIARRTQLAWALVHNIYRLEIICVALGSRVPFIIRPSEIHQCRLVGKIVLSSQEHHRDWRKTLYEQSKRLIGRRGTQNPSVTDGKSVEEPLPCPSSHATHILVSDAYMHEMMDGEAVSSGLIPVSIFLA